MCARSICYVGIHSHFQIVSQIKFHFSRNKESAQKVHCCLYFLISAKQSTRKKHKQKQSHLARRMSRPPRTKPNSSPASLPSDLICYLLFSFDGGAYRIERNRTQRWHIISSRGGKRCSPISSLPLKFQEPSTNRDRIRRLSCFDDTSAKVAPFLPFLALWPRAVLCRAQFLLHLTLCSNRSSSLTSRNSAVIGLSCRISSSSFPRNSLSEQSRTRDTTSVG